MIKYTAIRPRSELDVLIDEISAMLREKRLRNIIKYDKIHINVAT